MKYTDKEYFLEEKLVKSLDKYCERCSKGRNHQNVIIVDGQEGYGKSTFSSAAAYYMTYKMKRPLYLFFDMKKLMKFAQSREDCVFIWDDAAYSALSVQAYNTALIDFIKLLLLARKKRHTYFINIQELWRLKEPIASRGTAFVHVYSRDGGLTLGRFMHFSKKKLKIMLGRWYTKRKKKFGAATSRGTFPNVLHKIFDEKDYNILKDDAIMQIGKEKDKKKEEAINELKAKIALLIKKFKIPQKEAADFLGTTARSLQRWALGEVKEETATPINDSRQEIILMGYIKPLTTTEVAK
jgi:DNA-binding transcriptional regulator YiaG